MDLKQQNSNSGLMGSMRFCYLHHANHTNVSPILRCDNQPVCMFWVSLGVLNRVLLGNVFKIKRHSTQTALGVSEVRAVGKE